MIIFVKKFKWGIIGPGVIANKFAKAIKGINNMEICAVASSSFYKADKFAKEYKITNSYGSHEEMLLNRDIDAVYISTVNSAHYDNIMMCLDKGVPVLCEKPMVMSLKEFDDILNKSKEKKVALMEAMWTNLIPSMVEIKKHIENGTIGNISLAFIDFCVKFNKNPESRIYNKDLGGGVIFDLGVYNLHTVFNLFGEGYDFMSVCGAKGDTGVDIRSMLTFSYPNGMIVNTLTSDSTKGPYSMRIYGDKGSILSESFNDSQRFTINYDDGNIKEFLCPYDINGFEYEIREFSEVVKLGRLESEAVSLDRSRKVCEIMEDVHNNICKN